MKPLMQEKELRNDKRFKKLTKEEQSFLLGLLGGFSNSIWSVSYLGMLHVDKLEVLKFASSWIKLFEESAQRTLEGYLEKESNFKL